MCKAAAFQIPKVLSNYLFYCLLGGILWFTLLFFVLKKNVLDAKLMGFSFCCRPNPNVCSTT